MEEEKMDLNFVLTVIIAIPILAVLCFVFYMLFIYREYPYGNQTKELILEKADYLHVKRKYLSAKRICEILVDIQKSLTVVWGKYNYEISEKGFSANLVECLKYLSELYPETDLNDQTKRKNAVEKVYNLLFL